MKARVTLTTVFVLTVLTALAWQINTAKSEVVTKGLVSWWTLDEADIAGKVGGDTVEDVWGDNDGTITGDPERVHGKLAQCLKFSSERGDDCVVVEADASLNVAEDADFSVELWLNPTEVREQMVLFKGSAAFSFGYAFGMNRFGTANVNLVKCGITDQTKPYDFAAGEWHHVVAVQTVPQVEYFINGESIGAFIHDGAYTHSIGPFWIGGCNTYADVEDFDGLVDEVRIYDRALDEDEVVQNFDVKYAVTSLDKLAITWGETKASR